MRTIVHVSDIHFGRTDEQVVAELIKAVHKARPDIVAVSGDLTQRARPIEFEHARAFLDALPKPQIVVPGNHDVPLHNVFARFGGALNAYRKYITPDLEPFYRDDEVAILGLNTARSLTIKGGRVNERQIAKLDHHFSGVPTAVVKVLVTHHPFDLPDSYHGRHLVGRAEEAMGRIVDCRIDLLLAGHFHRTHSGPTAERYTAHGHSSIFVQAGTATSTRGRGEANSFNIIHANPNTIIIESVAVRSRGSFEPLETEHFHRTTRGWARTRTQKSD